MASDTATLANPFAQLDICAAADDEPSTTNNNLHEKKIAAYTPRQKAAGWVCDVDSTLTDSVYDVLKLKAQLHYLRKYYSSALADWQRALAMVHNKPAFECELLEACLRCAYKLNDKPSAKDYFERLCAVASNFDQQCNAWLSALQSDGCLAVNHVLCAAVLLLSVDSHNAWLWSRVEEAVTCLPWCDACAEYARAVCLLQAQHHWHVILNTTLVHDGFEHRALEQSYASVSSRLERDYPAALMSTLKARLATEADSSKQNAVTDAAHSTHSAPTVPVFGDFLPRQHWMPVVRSFLVTNLRNPDCDRSDCREAFDQLDCSPNAC